MSAIPRPLRLHGQRLTLSRVALLVCLGLMGGLSLVQAAHGQARSPISWLSSAMTLGRRTSAAIRMAWWVIRRRTSIAWARKG